jgi:hypothetical protein
VRTNWLASWRQIQTVRDFAIQRSPFRVVPAGIRKVPLKTDRNTRHPMQVVRLNRVWLKQYPAVPRRETLANAVAHRRFEQRNLPTRRSANLG